MHRRVGCACTHTSGNSTSCLHNFLRFRVFWGIGSDGQVTSGLLTSEKPCYIIVRVLHVHSGRFGLLMWAIIEVFRMGLKDQQVVPVSCIKVQ